MFKVDTKTGYKLFTDEEDANNYKDYLKNGLKVVRKSCGGWQFNDGSLLFDVTMKGSKDKKYILHKENKSIQSARLLKKYVAVLNKGVGYETVCKGVCKRPDEAL